MQGVLKSGDSRGSLTSNEIGLRKFLPKNDRKVVKYQAATEINKS